ncbi:MAG: hypothetical protein OEL66_10080 [Desulfobulbaceae bacterium]|nr:hypothetical protein [Desulfobulbaceae bacterium]
MLKKITAAAISMTLATLPTAALADSSRGVTRKWDPTDKVGKVRAQRYTTRDGKKILVDTDGKHYLLSQDGKRFMVDQAGNKIQVNQAGKIIEMNQGRNLKQRIGPGPLA